MSQSDSENRRVVTTPFIANFVSVFEPRQVSKDKPDTEYAVTATFKKDDPGLKKLRQAAIYAAKEKFGSDDAKLKKLQLRSPFRNGDDKPDIAGFAGMTYVKFSNKKYKPGLIDRNRKPILDKEAFYSGCLCRADVVAYAYESNGNRGMSFSLQNVQKIADGDRLSGGKPAEDVFSRVDETGRELADDEEGTEEDDVAGSDDDGLL